MARYMVRQLSVTSPSAPTLAALPQSHASLPAHLARASQATDRSPLTVTCVNWMLWRSLIDAGILSQCRLTLMFSFTSIAWSKMTCERATCSVLSLPVSLLAPDTVQVEPSSDRSMELVIRSAVRTHSRVTRTRPITSCAGRVPMRHAHVEWFESRRCLTARLGVDSRGGDGDGLLGIHKVGLYRPPWAAHAILEHRLQHWVFHLRPLRLEPRPEIDDLMLERTRG